MAIRNKKKQIQDSGGMKQFKKGANQGKKRRSIPPIQNMERNVRQYIVGQDEVVRKIITAIYRAIYLKSIKSNILVIGKSGTGKTETLKQIAQRLRIPYTIEDATKYTKEGYYGGDVEDMLENLLEAADYDLEKAQRGMLIIDEIDKKAGKDTSDVSGVEVLKSLLKIIEGAKYHLACDEVFDTRNLIVVFCGAFSGIEEIKKKRIGQKQIGFSSSHESDEKQTGYTKEDLVQYGLPEEFVGRIDTIVEMKPLEKEDLVQILKKSRLSIFRRYQKELRDAGISLQYNGKIFEEIAARSLKLDTGARELSNTVNYMFEDVIYNVMAHPGRYSKCTLSLEIVEDNTKYKLS